MLRSLVQLAVRNSLVRNALPLSATNSFVRGIGLVANDPPLDGTMAEVKDMAMAHMGLEHGYQPIPRTREHLLKYQPEAKDLPARSMKDSYTTAVIPLSKDKALQDKYVSFLGHVRLGRLMEDMDMFAVWVCHKHLQVPTLPQHVHLPYTFVTILVDKVTFTNIRTTAFEDIRISGHVSWVGKSSIEVVVWLEQKHGAQYEKITRALFLMAARNATNTAAAPVNPIVPADEEERKILAGGEERKKRRQLLQASSVFKVEPNNFEQTLMYNLYRRTTDTNTLSLNKRVLPGNCRWMSEWNVVNTIASFPEHRNAQNTVFGGFLMKSAVEISWVGAYLYCKARPFLEHICDISFEKPVSVSSFIKMTAYVVYTEVNYLVIMTVADCIDAVTGEQITSNVFYFIFSAPDRVPEILPRTYHETMWYLQGRRKFKYSLGLE